MKIPNRILSAILSIALLIPTAATTISAVSPDATPSVVAEATDISVTFDVTPVYEIGGDSYIKLNFNTAIDAEELEKVQIVSLSTNKALKGKWQGSGQQWQFIPYDIQDATYYTIVVPADFFAANGLQLGEAVTHTFRTAPGTSEPASKAVSVVDSFDCVTRRPERERVGFNVDESTKKFITADSTNGMIFNLAPATNRNDNQNVRMYAFEKIWDDPSYVGKTVVFSFSAKASEVGNIRLTLNQLHVKADNSANDYTYKNFPGLDATAELTTEWQTFTFEFTVTQAMYDQIAYGRTTNYSNTLALSIRFPGFKDTSLYKDAQICLRDLVVMSEDSETNIASGESVFAIFQEKDYSAAVDMDLRFAVENSAVATIGVYEAKPGQLGNKLGQVNVNGAGTYVLNTNAIMSYVKGCDGTPSIALKVESSNGTVDLVPSSIILAITTADTYEVLPNVSSSVIATNPNASQSGLWISGGQNGTENNDSAKSYIKLSLAGYTGGYAGFLFNAMSEGAATVSVYGVADVSDGQTWSPESITIANAPANDIYGSGVNINEVYGNASLATFRVGAYEENYRVDLTDFAEHMLAEGATEITLIIVTDSTNVTDIKVVDTVDNSIIATYNCVTSQPSSAAAGYTVSNYELLKYISEGFQIDTRGIAKKDSGFKDPNVRLYIFNEIWENEAYVGKTIRFTFSAKATMARAISLSLNQNGGSSAYVWGDGIKVISESTQLSTTWQTYSFEFAVTQQMYDLVKNGSINAPGFALGIRFTDFSDDGKTYNPAQITFRNFVISTSENVIIEPTYYKHYDFSSGKIPSAYGQMGYNLLDASISGTKPKPTTKVLNEELQIGFNDNIIVPVTKNQPYIRIACLDEIFADYTYVGETFTLSMRAKASEAGAMDIGLNIFCTFNTYTEGGKTYEGQVQLTPEYQTFTYTFTVTEGMVEQHNQPNGDGRYKNLNLALRFHNGFKSDTLVGNTSVYKNATIYVDDITVVSESTKVASVADASTAPIADVSYDRVFDGVKYDFSTNVPGNATYGYSAGQLGSVVDGEYVVDLSKQATGSNAGQVALVEALKPILNNAYVGKTFTVSFRARATVAGAVDFAINYTRSTTAYSIATQQYDVSTQYRTFTYTFTLTSDMASSDLSCGFRFYNGFRTGSNYNGAKIYIDDICVYEDFIIKETTLSLSDSVAINNSGSSDSLTAYATTNTVTSEINKSYLAYDLTGYSGISSATLNFNLSGANGETIRVYLLKNATLPANLTYANAPQPIGAAVLEFVATNGENVLNLTDLFVANEGTNIVLIFAIECLSGNIQITNVDLDVTVNTHDYTSESQRHVAVAPTYSTSGNVEFYTCAGCEKLYVKNGENYEEVTYDSIILPPVEYDTRFFSASLNIGKDLTMRYHVKISTGESADDFAVRFTLNDLVVTVTEYTFDDSGKPVFSFCGIAPQLMGDTVVAELIKGNDVMDSNEYSVKEYVADALVIYSNDNNLKQLLADLLNYGAAAQLYIGYKVDELVTDGFDLSAASTAVPTAADFKKTASTSTDPNVKFTASGVRFDYNNRIYVKFTAPSLDGIKVTVNGQELEIEATNQANVYIAYSDAISALHFTELVTFTLSSGGTAVQTLTYTINDYAYAKMGDTPIGRLSLALYRYGKSAVVYDNSK